MQSTIEASPAVERARLRGRGLHAALIVALTAAGTIVITRATAVASGRPALAPGPVAALPVVAAAEVKDAHEEAEPQLATHRFTGRIGENLTQSLQRAGVPEGQGREYVDVIGRAIALSGGLSVEDRFDLVVEQHGDKSFGRLLYVGLDRVGRADLALFKWTDGKTLIWVNADTVGQETAGGGMGMPVSGSVSSRFGNRFHPILGHARFHKGVDLRAGAGTPIVAAADGRVTGAGWHGGYGRQVAIAHAGGLRTTYSHMSRMAAAPGQLVRRGQVIGYVGSSGLSTGPHLHYEVYKNGRPVNPLSVKLTDAPVQLQGEKLHAFRDQLRAVLVPGP